MTTTMTIAVVTHGVCSSPVLISACSFDRQDEAGALQYINDASNAWIKDGKNIAKEYGGSFDLDSGKDSHTPFTNLRWEELFITANTGEEIILFAVDEATRKSWCETD